MRIDKKRIQDLILEKAFDYYKNKGFPYVNLEIYQIWEEFEKLLYYETESLQIKNRRPIFGFNNNKEIKLNVKKTLIGQDICYHFMRHEFSVFVNGSSGTSVDAFNNDKKLKRALCLVHKYGFPINDKTLLTKLKIVSGVQFATNFSPTVAKTIYESYGSPYYIYDYSAGFGGRLLGFLASNCLNEEIKYIGVDPSFLSFNSLNKMIGFFKVEKCAKIFRTGSEIFYPKWLINKVGLAFSSPPYFKKELYSDDSGQSYIKFPEYDQWLKEFWYKTIENCYGLLKPKGIFIANIGNINLDGKKYNLIEDSITFCNRLFRKRLLNFYMHMGGFGKDLLKNKKEIFIVFQKE